MHPGTTCPFCGDQDQQEWLSTTAAECNYCPVCDRRYATPELP